MSDRNGTDGLIPGTWESTPGDEETPAEHRRSVRRRLGALGGVAVVIGAALGVGFGVLGGRGFDAAEALGSSTPSDDLARTAEQWGVPLTTGTTVQRWWQSETGPHGGQDNVDVLHVAAGAPDVLTSSAAYTRTVAEAREEADLAGILSSTAAPDSLLSDDAVRCRAALHAQETDTLTLCRLPDGDVVVLSRAGD